MDAETPEVTPEAPIATPETVPEESGSVRDELVKALKESKDTEAKKIAPSVEETTTSEPTETAEAKRARDASGKFAKAPPAPVVAPAEAPKPVTAPQSWSAAAKAKWAAIPPEIQQEVYKREDEVTKGFTKLDEERNFGRQIKEVITPYMPQITAEGGDPVGAVKDLFNTAYQLRVANPQRKGQLLWHIAQQFGADMSQASPQAYVDPTIQQLQGEIAQLKGYLGSQESTKQQQEQATLQQTIDAFASDPKNVHFETVKAEMAALLFGGRAKDLQEAYDKAQWANPDIRSTLIQQQTAEAEAKRLADSKAKADAARRAGGSVVGGPGVSVPNTGAPNRDLRDELRANYRALVNG